MCLTYNIKCDIMSRLGGCMKDEFRFYVVHNPNKVTAEQLRYMLGPDTRITRPRNEVRAVIITPVEETVVRGKLALHEIYIEVA